MLGLSITAPPTHDASYPANLGQKLVDVIPEGVFTHLPFQEEGYQDWHDDTDLAKFLRALYDIGDTKQPTGPLEVSVNAAVGMSFYSDGKVKVLEWIARLLLGSASTKPVPASSVKRIDVPNLYSYTKFGRAAKYLIAWDNILGAVLSENAFFSLSHMLESESELNCSLLLCECLYYKQALQVIRSFLEELILPLHFCDAPSDYEQWKIGQYRIPQLRGRNGLLLQLVQRGILPIDLAEGISALYERLNGCIHSAESQMVHVGVYGRFYRGHIFRTEAFDDWCMCISDAVEFGIRLAAINTIQWSIKRPKGVDICDVCHSMDQFEVEYEELQGTNLRVLHCRRCGSTQRYSVE